MKSALFRLAAIALLALVCAPLPASALEPRKASDLVTLVADGSGDCPIVGIRFDTRVLPDGSQVPFTIPEKRVLVVTGVDFLINGATPGATVGALFGQQPDGAAGPSALVVMAAVVGPSGFAAGTASASPGVAVRAGAPLCITGADTAVLRGFLAKDK